MTIEEVSVLFDTGRKGDAKAAAQLLSHGGATVKTVSIDGIDVENSTKENIASHVETGRT